MFEFSFRFLSSRSNCVLPQFLTEETNYPYAPDVESYWMETSCPKETIGHLPMDNLQDLCENPGNYNFLEAHLPVSEADTRVHYRNVFCAFCWNVSPMQLKTWLLEVHCHKQLDVSDRNILLETRNEKCNIFFKPPYYYDQNMCTFPQYTIYECNQSGLLQDKDEMLEWACNKYYDPYNTTYKNFFCYLCNVDDINPPNNLHCPDALPSTVTKRAPHIARFELTAWRSARYKELMCDEMTEFTDYKMVR